MDAPRGYPISSAGRGRRLGLQRGEEIDPLDQFGAKAKSLKSKQHRPNYTSDLEDTSASESESSASSSSSARQHASSSVRGQKHLLGSTVVPSPLNLSSSSASSTSSASSASSGDGKVSMDELRWRSGRNVAGMDAYTRHIKFMNDYVMYYGGSLEEFKRPAGLARHDDDILKERFRFIRTDQDDRAENPLEAWEKRLAKRYYDKLFREYALADLTRYKEDKVGLRWRVEREVREGKGQFICGNKHCSSRVGLKSYEVNFQYSEDGQTKNALVKVRVCPDCAYKLNYKQIKKRKREEKELRRKLRKEQKKAAKKKRVDGFEGRDEESDRGKLKEVKKEEEEEEEEDEGEKERLRAEEEARKAKEREDELKEREAERMRQIWKGPAPVEQAKDQEEEFEEFFRGLFP